MRNNNSILSLLKCMRMFFLSLPILFLSVQVQAQKSDQQKPMMIEQQGSFAVGGTVITNQGTFDPYKPTPEGQTFHGDHAYVFIPDWKSVLPKISTHEKKIFNPYLDVYQSYC